MSLSDRILRGQPRQARFPTHLECVIEVAGRAYACVLHDLSRTGACFEDADIRPAEGSPVRFSIHSPSHDLEFRGAGRVVRAKSPENTGHPQVAVEFEPLTQDQLSVLEAIIARILETPSGQDLPELPPGASPATIRKALEQVPLAHRIALASRAGPRERKLLIHDTQPPVLEALLRNPNLLAKEAAVLLESPYLSPAAIQHVARDSRWAREESLLVLAASHRKTPPAVAREIVGRLSPQALRQLQRRSHVAAELRRWIRKRLVQAPS